MKLNPGETIILKRLLETGTGIARFTVKSLHATDEEREQARQALALVDALDLPNVTMVKVKHGPRCQRCGRRGLVNHKDELCSECIEILIPDPAEDALLDMAMEDRISGEALDGYPD